MNNHEVIITLVIHRIAKNAPLIQCGVENVLWINISFEKDSNFFLQKLVLQIVILQKIEFSWKKIVQNFYWDFVKNLENSFWWILFGNKFYGKFDRKLFFKSYEILHTKQESAMK